VELLKLNFQLSEKLHEHNLIEEAWSYSGKNAKNITNVIKRIADINVMQVNFA
jgi:hypothetical protein